jgi:hypothetical protein
MAICTIRNLLLTFSKQSSTVILAIAPPKNVYECVNKQQKSRPLKSRVGNNISRYAQPLTTVNSQFTHPRLEAFTRRCALCTDLRFGGLKLTAQKIQNSQVAEKMVSYKEAKKSRTRGHSPISGLDFFADAADCHFSTA